MKNKDSLLQQAFKTLVRDKDILAIGESFFAGDFGKEQISKSQQDKQGVLGTYSSSKDYGTKQKIKNIFRNHVGHVTFPDYDKSDLLATIKSIVRDFVPENFYLNPGGADDIDLIKIKKKFPNLFLVLRDLSFYTYILQTDLLSTLVHELAHAFYLPSDAGDDLVEPDVDDSEKSRNPFVRSKEWLHQNVLYPERRGFRTLDDEQYATSKEVKVMEEIIEILPNLFQNFKSAYRIKAPNFIRYARKSWSQLESTTESDLAGHIENALAYYTRSSKKARGTARDPKLSSWGSETADLDSIREIPQEIMQLKINFRAKIEKAHKTTAKLAGPSIYAECIEGVSSKLQKTDKKMYESWIRAAGKWTATMMAVKSYESALLGIDDMPKWFQSWIKVEIFNTLLGIVTNSHDRYKDLYPGPRSPGATYDTPSFKIDYNWSPYPIAWKCIMRKFDFVSGIPNTKQNFKKFRIPFARKS
jgi:hypothetical protein